MRARRFSRAKPVSGRGGATGEGVMTPPQNRSAVLTLPQGEG